MYGNITVAGKYVHGKGGLSNLGKYAEKLELKPFVLVRPPGMKRVKEFITKSFGRMPPVFQESCGECSKKEKNRLIERQTKRL